MYATGIAELVFDDTLNGNNPRFETFILTRELIVSRAERLAERHGMTPQQFLWRAVRHFDSYLTHGAVATLTEEERTEVYRQMSGAPARDWWNSLSKEDRDRITRERSSQATERWRKRKEKERADAAQSAATTR